jgi:20S proteasome alpha/beta subunit
MFLWVVHVEVGICGLTAIIGAHCRDGIVLVGDRKYTYPNRLRRASYGTKLFGDLRGVIIGFSGGKRIFDVFRRYVVGDVTILRDAGERYIFDDIIPRTSKLIAEFNQSLMDRIVDTRIQVLIGLHPKHELWWVNKEGRARQIDYKAIGQGEITVNAYCRNASHRGMTMKEFARYPYSAILHLEKFERSLGVGIGKQEADVWYLPDGEDQDRPAPRNDLLEFKQFAKSQIAAMRAGRRQD